MRAVGVAAVIVLAVVLAAGQGRRAASAWTAAESFRVATFNIHKGANRKGHYDLGRTIEAIRRLDADLVGTQEVMRNQPDFNCDDQPALIAEGLRRRTGRPWTYVHQKAWVTDDRRCRDRGHGSDVATEELAIFSASPITDSRVVRLSEGRVGLAVRVAALPQVPIVVTHLAANRENQRGRMEELGVLLPWAARQGPGLLIGDFNAQPDAVELGPVMARYHDAWADAAADEHITGVVSGSTRPGRRFSRIDFVLYDEKAGLRVESAEVFDVSDLPGLGEVSDHQPVVATFRAR
ncbi:MAG: hypothetical protein HY824_15690 [Acidobacteria bacterium]|nr:hypothetical protein [Acidobacteriota bacterium]